MDSFDKANQRRKLPSWSTCAEISSTPTNDSLQSSDDTQDDYTTMLIEDQQHTLLPAHSAKRARLVRQARAQYNQRSEQRDLRTSDHDRYNRTVKAPKAKQIMLSMGYQEGMPLGKGNGLESPIVPVGTARRQGLGFRAQLENGAEWHSNADTQEQADCGSLHFRNVLTREQNTKHLEFQVKAAQTTCRALDTESSGTTDITSRGNVLWQSLEPQNDAQAETAAIDNEAKHFEKLSATDRLIRILVYMRKAHYYCFWCGCKYNDLQDMLDTCPGLTESAHD